MSHFLNEFCPRLCEKDFRENISLMESDYVVCLLRCSNQGGNILELMTKEIKHSTGKLRLFFYDS